MTKEITSKNLFPSDKAFLSWLEKKADTAFVQKLKQLDMNLRNQIRTVYNEYGAFSGKADMGETSTLMGRAIANWVDLIKKEETLSSRTDKKAFVTAASVAHFRLLDNGLSGEETNFMAEHAAHLHKAFPNGPEKDFVLPMADVAIDRIFEMLQRIKDPLV